MELKATNQLILEITIDFRPIVPQKWCVESSIMTTYIKKGRYLYVIEIIFKKDKYSHASSEKKRNFSYSLLSITQENSLTKQQRFFMWKFNSSEINFVAWYIHQYSHRFSVEYFTFPKIIGMIFFFCSTHFCTQNQIFCQAQNKE